MCGRAAQPCRVSLPVDVTTLAATFLVSRSFTPTTAVLPTAPLPAFSLLLACLFFSYPPK